MDQHVCLQVSLLVEALVAPWVRANVRTHAFMNANMIEKAAEAAE